METKQTFKLVGAGNTESQEKISKPTLSFTQDAWRRLRKNKLAVISIWFLAVLLVFSIGSTAFVSTNDANSFKGTSKNPSFSSNLITQTLIN
ncbi:ABC transporter permease, partial [Streptococcus danieliae]|nr:ABC transporter permease [Streptococcus danieliae]